LVSGTHEPALYKFLLFLIYITKKLGFC